MKTDQTEIQSVGLQPVEALYDVSTAFHLYPTWKEYSERYIVFANSWGFNDAKYCFAVRSYKTYAEAVKWYHAYLGWAQPTLIYHNGKILA